MGHPATIALHYYFSDHLGTHAVVENATGTQCEQDIDYYPYGGQQNDYCTTPVVQGYKFNGKERDGESGLDNFGARYDTSNLGRFMTPDWAAKPTTVPYANFGNPQSLNLYSYVENNPTTLGDPDGHAPWGTAGGGTDCDHGILTQCSQETQAAAAQAAANANAQQGVQAQHQNQKPGFWHRLGQHFRNLFGGQSWSYKMREEVTTRILFAEHREPNASVTAATDIAGLFGIVAPKVSKELHLGPATAIVSITNDPKPWNTVFNLLGLAPGFDAPMAITGAFNDGFDYGMHHNQGRVGDKSDVLPTRVYDETGNSMPNPALDPCGGMCN